MANGDEELTARQTLGRVGFETASDLYERARPTYPDAAVHALEATAGIAAGSRVLDLAAGTGKLTRQLHADGAGCVAVEPSASMRDVFRKAVPGVSVAAGTAEAIPLATSSVDTVVVAQAFTGSMPPVPWPRSPVCSDPAAGWPSSGTSGTRRIRTWPSWSGSANGMCPSPIRWGWTSERPSTAADCSTGGATVFSVRAAPRTERLRRAGGLP